jgi:hypothetical protein
MSGGRTCCLKQGGMFSEDNLNLGGFDPLVDVADPCVSGGAAPRQTDGRVQLAAVARIGKVSQR